MRNLVFRCIVFFVGIFFIFLSFSFSLSSKEDLKKLRVNKSRIERRITDLAEFGKNPQGGISRVAFSDADILGRSYIVSQMKEAGLKVRIDEAGNIIGRKKGSDPGLPPILIGSHTDSVPSGGKFDGAVGVIDALECAQVFFDQGIMLRHPLDVVVFTDEEGGLIGSKAMVGELTETALDVVSHSGKTVREGILAIGGDPAQLSKVVRKKGDIKAFIEIHIEQGSILESKDLDIGIVEGIVGINWWDVTIEGFSNHAGTTPMNMRHDALLAAARLVIAVNDAVTSEPGRQVGTVGRIRAEPGAPNVIPGKVVMSLEIRDLSTGNINRFFEKIKNAAGEIAKKSGTKISFLPIDATAIPAPTDIRIRKCLEESCRDLGLASLFMPSGAGHDAQNMTRITPTGLIFVPSAGGVSHSPMEYTRLEDIVNGANVLLHTILRIDQGALDE